MAASPASSQAPDPLRDCRIPAIAPRQSTTTRTPTISTGLSAVPSVEVAQSLSHSGVRSIAALPTAIAGEVDGPTTPATR